MKKNYSTLYSTKNIKFFKGFFLAITLLFFANSINAQITVTNPGNASPALAATYTTLNTALTQLSLATSFTGPVVITVNSSGYTETAPVGGFVISYSAASSSAINNVIIDGNGASFTAAAGLTAGNYNDAIIKIKGSDFITIQNFKLYENANVLAADLLPSTNKMTEWGIALLYKTTTDGCQNVTLKNNIIDLNKNYTNAIGIYANAAHADAATVALLSTTPVSATTTAGGNNNLTIIQNTITDINQGIVVSGPIAIADYNNILTIGGSVANANTITNFGTILSTTLNGLPTAISATIISGISIKNTINYTISYNNINNTNSAASAVGATALRGILVQAFNTAPTQNNINNNINFNTLSLKTNYVLGSIIGIQILTSTNATAVTGSTANIDDNIFDNLNNTATSPTGIIYGIDFGSAALNVSISRNQFRNMAFSTSGNCYLISGSSLFSINQTINGNKICDNSGSTSSLTPLLTKSGGTFSGCFFSGVPVAGSVFTVTNNNFSNVAVTGGTIFYGIKYNPTTTLQTAVINNNTITNITVGSLAAFGISKSGGTAASTINKNVIGNFTNATGTGNITGIIFDEANAGAGTTCAANKIYDLIGNSAAATVFGISYSGAGSGTNLIYNNFIGNLKSTAFTSATTPYIGVSGINLLGSTAVTHKLFNNTIYIPAGTSSGANFTSNCVFMGNNTSLTSLVMQNNLLVNLSTPTGSGKAVAFQKDAAIAIAKYVTPSNNNSLWGTTGLYWDGTATAPPTTLATYKSAVVSPKDLASLNINPTFDSLDGTNNKFLHLSDGAGGATTLLESGGTTTANAVTSGANLATPDLDGDARPGPAIALNGGGSSYDIGADEFDGIPAKPVISAPTVVAGAGNPCTTNLPRTLTFSILNNGPLRTANPVQLTYYFNGVLQATISPTTAGSSLANAISNWVFDIPAATSTSTTVTWTITAVEDISNATGTLSGTYRDQSTSGITATATSSSATICAGGSTTLTATFASSYIETGTVAPAIVTNPTLEEDISNVTLSQGATVILNNTSARNSLVGSIGTATGTAGSYADYTGFGTPAGSGYPVKAGLTYNFSLSSVLSTATLTNAFAIYIDYNKNGVLETTEKVFASGGATLNGHTETGTFTIPTTAAGGKTRMRVIVKEGSAVTSGTADPVYGEFEDYTLNIEPKFVSYSWNFGSAGGTQVATTNPALITGASAGTYFITATDTYGCTVVASVSIAGSALMSNPVVAIPSSYAVCNATVNLSTDVTGGCAPLTYSWTATGPAGSVMTFSDPTAATPTFGGSLSGNYTVTCVITDFSTATRTATHVLPIVISNPTPTVTGGPYSLCGAGTLSLTASKSNAANILNWYDSNAVGAAALGSGSPFVSPIISASTTYYVEEGIGGPATGVIGSGIASNATNTAIGAFYGSWFGNGHSQILIKASELSAAGLTSGSLTSLSLNITGLGLPSNTFIGFNIKIANTVATSITTFQTTGFTNVWGPIDYTPVIGTNTHNFSTPYYWDGTSNIIVDYCFASQFFGSASCINTITTTTFNSFVNYNADNAAGAGACSTTIVSNTSFNRPNLTFSGQTISCRGAKVAVPITFIPPPDLTLSSNITLCNDSVGMIKATTPVGNFTNYSWSPTTNLWVDAAGSATPYTGQNVDIVYVRGTTAGTQTYILTGINGTCTNKATVTVVILPQPTITSSATSYCVSGTPTLSLSPATGYTGGFIQWKSATALGGPYANIPGGNTASFTLASPITATTYFQAVLSNSAGGSCTAVAPIAITVDSPAITSNTPATRCGTGTVNLAAVSSTGVVKWYTAATGGTSLYTGSPFTTPTIAATTTYYAEAASASGATFNNLGNTSIPTATGFIASRGIVFSASQTGIIVSAQYYSPTLNVTNNITVTLVDNATGTLLNTVPLSIVQGSTAGFYTMNLNLAVTAGTTYRLLASFSQSVNRIDTGADYTNVAFNNLAPLGVITSGYDSGVSTTSYNYFHNISVLTSCTSSRMAVAATITAPPTLALSNVSAAICAGTPSDPITLTSAAANFDTYVWSPATGVTGDATAGWVFNPTLSAVYTLTASQTSGLLCANTATVALTVNQLPATLTMSPLTAFTCPGKAQLMSVTAPVNVSIIESFDNPSSLFNITQTVGTYTTSQSSYFAEGTAAVLFNTSTSSTSNDGACQMTSSIDLTTTRNPVLTFKHICATEATFDFGYVQYSVDGGATWTSFPASSYSGSAVLKNGVVSFDKTSYTDWGTTFTSTTSNPGAAPASSLWKSETLTIPLAAMSSTQFKVRFKLITDGTILYYGWLIDDFKLKETNPANLVWSATPATPLYIDNLAAPTLYNTFIHINQALIYAKPLVNTVIHATITYPLSGCFSDSTCLITTNGAVTYSGGSWVGGLTPVAGKAIVFDSGTYNSTTDLQGCSCTVNSGANVTINGNLVLDNNLAVDPAATMTFSNNATLLQINNPGAPSLALNPANTGNITYKRTTSTLANNYDFVYWGSPVKNQVIGNIWMDTTGLTDSFYYFNPASVTATDPYAGWIDFTATSIMIPGKGYISRARSGLSGWTPGNTWTANFNGIPNNGTITPTGSLAVGAFSKDNLIANPYPSAIDIIAFQNDSANANKTLKNYYFWSHFTPYSGTVYISDDYSIYNGTLGAGVGTAPISNGTGQAPDRYVPAGQAFFVERNGTIGSTVSFKNVHRVSSNNADFYRKAHKTATSSSDFVKSDKLWLNLSNHQGIFKQFLVAYADGATNDYDLFYEAKSQDGNSFADFYTTIPDNKFVIQSRSPFVANDLVSIGFKTVVAGNYWINIDHADALFTNNQTVYLQDNLLQIDHDLSASPYKFTTEVGEFNERFVLKYKSYLPTLPTDAVIVANTKQSLNIRSLLQNIEKVTVYDLLGRLVYEKEGVHSKNFADNKVVLNTQTLIVKITLENDEVVTHKILFE